MTHPKKILYYQCFSGISGDMNLAAMVDLGVPADHLKKELEKLALSNVKIHFRRESRNAIFGIQATVEVTHPTHLSRKLQDIYEIIDEAALERAVAETAKEIFRKLAEAEGKIHNKPPDKIHFHEVGGEDAIIDIVGASIAYHYLKVDEVWASTVELGSGFVKSAHGVLPVPAPATALLLEGIPVRLGGAGFETTTPTGAAILATLVSRFTDEPAMTLQQSGYGIGHHKGEQRPNMLRLFVGEVVTESGTYTDRAEELECTIDDMDPQWYEWLISRLFKEGAQDVTLTPVIMKKGRPGTRVTVLSPPEKTSSLGELLLTETTTIGYRRRTVEKHTLQRKERILQTPYGEVRIKESYLQGRLITRKPEYDDCRQIAARHHLPLPEVYKEIEKLMQEEYGS